MDAEARFLGQARRGTATWRRQQRWGLYVATLSGLVALVSAPRLFLDDAGLYGAALQTLAALALLTFGIALWQHARVMEGAALHFERLAAPPA